MGYKRWARAREIPKDEHEVPKLFAHGSLVAVGAAVVRYSPLTVMPVGAIMIGWGLSRLSRQLTTRIARAL